MSLAALPDKLFFRLSASARLILLVSFFALTATAQTISGTISDERNAPVENAEVSLFAGNKILARTKSDAQGKFSLLPNNGNDLILRVSAKGFAIFEKRLSELKTPLEIVLPPADVREEVTVSIAGAETRLSETPASVVVLSRETLEATAAQTIDDALRQVAGFTLFRRSSSKTTNPTTQGANLRGISGSGAARAAVLFDDVSLNDAFGGWTYWNRVPRAAIETAEILRGGASSIYGSSALSGAVNLTTRRAEPDKPILSFETSAGTQNTFDGSLFTAFGRNGWNASLAVESFQTAGYIPIAKEERGAADSRANSRHNSGFLTLERRFDENARIFARGNLFAERRDNGTRLQKNRTYFRQGVFGADFSDDKFGSFQFRASIEAQVYDQTFSAVSADRSTENLTRIQRVPSQAKGANVFWSRAFGNHIVSSSAEAREVRGFSDESIINNNRATSLVGAGGREFSSGVFIQDFWRVNRKLNVNFGARLDYWKNFNALSTIRNLISRQTTVVVFPTRNQQSFSPRVGAIYQIDDNFSVLGSFSKSFRAPTLNELYRAFRVGNVLTTANENLLAERATTYETGANFTGFSRRLNLRANIFLTEVSNPVVSITLNSTPTLITRRRQNVGKTRTRGIELDAEFSPRRDWRFSASYLLVDSRVADFPANPNLEGKFLPQIPKQQLTFQAFYRPQKKFSFGLQARLSGAQFEDDRNTLRLRPFFTMDWLGSYRLREKIEIFAAVENVFNNRYDIGLTPNRTIAAPRFARIGLRY
ncbi:MAG: TonB-dependent receptor [Acidobacteriota bacterium]|nr:TonB-dependent receptor [Acidobacteriota bacterium]